MGSILLFLSHVKLYNTCFSLVFAMTDFLKKMCLPAKIYLAILVISIVFAVFQGITLPLLLLKTVFGFIWMWILNWICSKGYTNLSWVLLLLPYVLMFIIIATTVEVVNILKADKTPVVISQDSVKKDTPDVVILSK